MGITPNEDLNAIIAASLAAADARQLVARAAAPPSAGAAQRILAVGKAAPRMFEGFVASAGPPASALMVVPEGVDAPPWALRADHPVPTRRNLDAATRAADFAVMHRHDAGGFVVLLSGGASALLTLPAPALKLEDIRALTKALLASGADIQQINCVRRHVEQLKGGRLASLMAPAEIEAMVLSDVIGDDPASIGSGPVSPDPTTFAQARAIVERFAPRAASILEFLKAGEAGAHEETPKPGSLIFARIRLRIIGNNAVAMRAAEAEAAARGYRIVHIEDGVSGEAADAGRRLARLALNAEGSASGPCCILMGGETTVSLGLDHGKGGRNQELALAAALEIEGHDRIVIAAFATDGVDGPTEAAGAIATGGTCAAARALHLDPREHLRRHDSWTLFGTLRTLIQTGPTGTNVNDVAIALIL